MWQFWFKFCVSFFEISRSLVHSHPSSTSGVGSQLSRIDLQARGYMVLTLHRGLLNPLCWATLVILISCALSTPLDDAIAHLTSLSYKTTTTSAFLARRYPLTYDVGTQGQVLNFARTEFVIPVLWGNTLMGDTFPVMAAVGKDPASNTRYATWSTNPFSRSKSKPAEANVIITALNTIAWAFGETNYTSAFGSTKRNVTLSFVRSSSIWQDAGDSVFKTFFPGWTVSKCDGEKELESCLAKGSGHFAGSYVTMTNTKAVGALFKARMDAGYPFMYFHDNNWGDDLAGSSGALLGLTLPYGGTFNNPQKVNITDARAVSSYIQNNFEYLPLKDVLIRARDSTFTWNISKCSDEPCTGDPLYASELLTTVNSIRSMIELSERNGVSPLDDTVYSPMMNKLVLAGDYLRADTRYPLNTTHSPTTWSKAILADALYTQLRSSGTAQNYLGTFGKTIGPTVPRISKIVTIQTRTSKFITSAGVFAAPGDTITIRRLDSNELKTDPIRVFVNQIRANSYPIRDRRLTRPYWLTGNAIPVNTNSSISINSAYGGIIYVSVPEGVTWHSEIQLSFTNVVQHPVYIIGSGLSTRNWTDSVNSDIFGWAEILHPHIQVHMEATYAKIFTTMFPYPDSAVEDFETYLYNYHYTIAGFWSSERTINPLPGLAAKATAFGLRGLSLNSSSHELVSIQHMNSDGYSLCGSGCSGNPIDMTWTFNAVGWGEHHELGHNVQYARFKMNAGATTEISNNIFPYSVYFKIAFEDTRLLRSVGSSKNIRRESEDSFKKMEEAKSSGKTPEQVGVTPAQHSFYLSLILSSSDKFAERGFEMVPMLYLMSRSIDAEKNWTAARDNYGLTLYDSIREIDSVTYPGNDFLLLAVSWLNRLDYRSFFWSWGATWSPKVNDQINLWGFDRKVPNFTYITDNYTTFGNYLIENTLDPYNVPRPTPPQAPQAPPQVTPSPVTPPPVNPPVNPAVTPPQVTPPPETPPGSPPPVNPPVPLPPVTPPTVTPPPVTPPVSPPAASPPVKAPQGETPPSDAPQASVPQITVPQLELYPTVATPQDNTQAIAPQLSGSTSLPCNFALAAVLSLLLLVSL